MRCTFTPFFSISLLFGRWRWWALAAWLGLLLLPTTVAAISRTVLELWLSDHVKRGLLALCVPWRQGTQKFIINAK